MDKGQIAIDWMPFMIIYMVVVLAIIFAFFWAAYSFAGIKADIPKGLESYVLEQRFLNLPDCFLHIYPYVDKADPIILDWERFNGGNLNNCYYTTEGLKFRAYNLTLKTKEEEKSIKTTNWDSDDIYFIRKSIKVLVYFDNKVIEGELIIRVQNEPF